MYNTIWASKLCYGKYDTFLHRIFVIYACLLLLYGEGKREKGGRYMNGGKLLTKSWRKEQWRLIKKSKYWLLFLVPGIIYYFVFHYAAMYGVIIAFKDFNAYDGILGSPWAANHGLENFIELFQSPTFFRILKNTVLLSLYTILFSFPIPILLALALNEMRNGVFKRFAQTVSYLPHFISTVVICGIAFNFLSMNGLINQIIQAFGGEGVQFLLLPECFRTIYVATDIWQKAGWNSIIYIAALTTIDTSQYEAAKIDGIGRLQKIWYIDLPALVPTILILLIMNIGGIMTAGFEKVLLLYNPNTYETADIIGTYVYRVGISGAQFSFATAVGLFQSVIGFILVIITNRMSNKISGSGLW